MASTIRLGAVGITVEAVGQVVKITLTKGMFAVSQEMTPFEAVELRKAIEHEETEAYCVWSKNVERGAL